jgi:hypothetical protein
MKKGTKFFIAAVAMFIGLSMSSFAQLEAGSFGIGAFFAGGSSTANGFYALAENMEIGVGLGYQSQNYDMDVDGFNAPDPGSELYFTGTFKYFLSKGRDVSPFVGGRLEYSSDLAIGADDPVTGLGLGAMFGAQGAIAKNLHIYGYVSLSYFTTSSVDQDVTSTYTYLTLSGSGVGAIFYF